MTTQRDRWHTGSVAGPDGLSDSDGLSWLGLTTPSAMSVPDLTGFGAAIPAGPTAAAPASQLVFIEGNVPDIQDLVNGLQPGAQAVVLDPNQDGVQQIAAYLTQHNVQNLTAIDIVAHGSDGQLMLGSGTLSAATIPSYKIALQQIGVALAPNGAIQIYGCDVAQDATGVSVIDQLSQATGVANIDAASHLVGAASGGGSFDLNINVGTVTASAPFTAGAEESFQGELGTTITVSTEAQLNNAIGSIDGTTVAGTYEIDISANITASGTAFTGIDLHSGVSLSIVGAGHTLSGGGSYRGLFAYAGNVIVNNLTIANAQAYGGAGGNSGNFAGGGGAGLGGGLFVGKSATVTLNQVYFSGDKAQGGAGGNGRNGTINKGYADQFYAGGGGMGGASALARSASGNPCSARSVSALASSLVCFRRELRGLERLR